MTDHHRHPSACRGRRKVVLSPLTLVNVSPVRRFLQIDDKLYILPLSPWEKCILARGCFCKTQAASRIPLTMSKSLCKTKQKLLA